MTTIQRAGIWMTQYYEICKYPHMVELKTPIYSITVCVFHVL